MRRADVPRAEYTKLPGPFPSIPEIKRFRFREEQRRTLIQLLPRSLARLSIPSNDPTILPDAAMLPVIVKTIADLVVHRTEYDIRIFLTTEPLISEGRISPSNVKVAIFGSARR